MCFTIINQLGAVSNSLKNAKLSTWSMLINTLLTKPKACKASELINLPFLLVWTYRYWDQTLSFNIIAQVSHYELLEAAFDEELTSRIKEIANLSDEIVTLKTTLEETINNSKGKVQRTDSSIEFELLHASTKQVREGSKYKIK